MDSLEPLKSLVISQTIEDSLNDLRTCFVTKHLIQVAPNHIAQADTRPPMYKLPDDQHKPWRVLLNKLCFLCHFNRGGDTVTGIAVEDAGTRVTFWLTTNDKPNTATNLVRKDTSIYSSEGSPPAAQARHLTKVLEILAENIEANEACRERAARKIAQMSIVQAKKRVHHYRTSVKRLINDIKREFRNTIAITNNDVLGELDDLMDGIVEHKTLYEAAYKFQQSSTYQKISALAESSPAKQYFKNIVHLIGRLNSWRIAARVVVRNAIQFADIIKKASVCPIDQSLFTESDVCVEQDLETHLAKTLGQNNPLLGSALERLKPVEGKLASLNGKRPAVHAEAAMAQWFHIHKRRFVFDDRYIACSKPSCYGCNLYLKRHPERYVARPSHDNVWVDWTAPRFLNVDGDTDKKQDHETAIVLRIMAQDVRGDIDECVRGERYGTRRKFESTTGKDTSVRKL